MRRLAGGNMTQFSRESVWQVMQGRSHDLFLANALLPCIAAFLYGCYNFYELGTSTDHFAQSYIPLVGAIISAACMMAFSLRGVRSVLIPPRAFALYILSVLGGMGIASSAWPAMSIWGIVKGAIWAFLGWRMFRRLGKATDLTRTPIDLPNLKDHLVSHVGLHHRDLATLIADENLAAHLGSRL